jgi:hypothetical protein
MEKFMKLKKLSLEKFENKLLRDKITNIEIFCIPTEIINDLFGNTKIAHENNTPCILMCTDNENVTYIVRIAHPNVIRVYPSVNVIINDFKNRFNECELSFSITMNPDFTDNKKIEMELIKTSQNFKQINEVL